MTIDLPVGCATAHHINQAIVASSLDGDAFDRLLGPLVDDLSRAKDVDGVKNILEAAAQAVDRVDPKKVATQGDEVATVKQLLQTAAEDTKAIDSQLFDLVATIAVTTGGGPGAPGKAVTLSKLSGDEATALRRLAEWILGQKGIAPGEAKKIQATVQQLQGLDEYSITPEAKIALGAINDTLTERIVAAERTRQEQPVDYSELEEKAARQAQNARVHEAAALIKKQIGKGTSGVLDHAKLDYFDRLVGGKVRSRWVLGMAKAEATFTSEQIAKIQGVMKQLRELADRQEGGTIRTYATVLPTGLIEDVDVRQAAQVAGRMINKPIHADPGALDRAELATSLRLLASDAPADTEAKRKLVESYAKEINVSTRGGIHELAAIMLQHLETVDAFMKYGTSSLLVCGSAELAIGERWATVDGDKAIAHRVEVARRLDLRELRNAKGQPGAVKNEKEAQGLVQRHMQAFDDCDMDVICLYHEKTKRLLVATNEHGDLDSIAMNESVEFFDRDNNSVGTAKVIFKRDVINSLGEAVPGFYAKAVKAGAEKIQALIDPNKIGGDVFDKARKDKKANAMSSIMGLAGLAAVFSAVAAKATVFGTGLVASGAIPGAINWGAMAMLSPNHTAIEKAMGLTAPGLKRR